MRAWLLLPSVAAALTLVVPAAEPAARAPRFLLALAAGGSAALYESADGIRFAAAPGYAPGPATSPALVRRGSTVYLYDAPQLTADGLQGSVRRFSISASGLLAGQLAAAYRIQLAAPGDAARASAGSFAPAVAVDDAGAIVILYPVRLEPETNACPVAGQACVKLRTATEVAGSDGLDFTGDAGNRIVLSFPAADAIEAPSLFRSQKGWSALARGPDGCLHLLTAADPHRAYRNGGCISDSGPETPSAVWDARLREYRLYGVVDGKVVRAVAGRLSNVASSRFRPLAIPVQPSVVRVVPNAP